MLARARSLSAREVQLVVRALQNAATSCCSNSTSQCQLSLALEHSSAVVSPNASGFHDAHGNVWQWTEDHFAPLPGFEIHYFYGDFSSPCFDGWHSVIMGGSWASTGDLASSFARYRFRRHFFQHSGFRYQSPHRCARAVPRCCHGCRASGRRAQQWSGSCRARMDPRQTASVRFFQRAISASSGSASLVSVAGAASAAGVAAASSRLLHLGCAAGAGSFDLARAGFGSVTGVDADEPSIATRAIMKHHGQFESERPTEGVLTEPILSVVGATPAQRSAVDFTLGSLADAALEGASGQLRRGRRGRAAHALRAAAGRPPEGRRGCAAGRRARLASDNDWRADQTPRSSWCGGFKMTART